MTTYKLPLDVETLSDGTIVVVRDGEWMRGDDVRAAPWPVKGPPVEFEALTGPCPNPECRGGEIQYPEWEGHTERCTDCVNGRPLIDVRRQASIYVASRAHHGPLWRQYRADGRNIISSWIDVAGENEIDDWPSFWADCTNEAILADVVVAYHEPGDDPWKGALIEIGAALGHANAVHLVGSPAGSWTKHPDVTGFDTLADAFDACSTPLGRFTVKVQQDGDQWVAVFTPEPTP